MDHGHDSNDSRVGLAGLPLLVEFLDGAFAFAACHFFAARTNTMPGRKMISGGKMNTHASTQRR